MKNRHYWIIVFVCVAIALETFLLVIFLPRFTSKSGIFLSPVVLINEAHYGDPNGDFLVILNQAKSDEKEDIMFDNNTKFAQSHHVMCQDKFGFSSKGTLALMTNNDKISNLYPFNNDTNFPREEHILCQPKLELSDKETLLILVVSAFGNQRRRHCIRQTWADRDRLAAYSRINNVSVAVVFVIGVPLGNDSRGNLLSNDSRADTLAPAMSAEMRAHRDLLLVAVADTYETIVYKEQAALAWILNNTGADVVTNVVKTDDDSLVNTVGWTSLLHKYRMDGNNQRYIIGSRCLTGKKVVEFKGHMMRKEYPHSTYPPSCQGEGYLLSRGALVAIVEAMRHDDHEAFWIEDVYITGIMAQRTNTSLYVLDPLPSAHQPHSNTTWQLLRSPTLQKPMIVHRMSTRPTQWRRVWQCYVKFYANHQNRLNVTSIKALV